MDFILAVDVIFVFTSICFVFWWMCDMLTAYEDSDLADTETVMKTKKIDQ